TIYPYGYELRQGLARPDGQGCRGGLAAFGEALKVQARVEERVQEPGQRAVRGPDLVAHALVGPGGLGPVPVAVPRRDQHGAGIGTVGEPAAKARVDAD